MRDKDLLFKYLLVWLILFAGVIMGICFMPGLEQATGTLHPEYSTMLHSGSSVSSNSITKWIAYAYGIGIIGTLTFCILIATRKEALKTERKLHKLVIIGGVIYAAVFSVMVLSYWSYSKSGDANYFLGFPAPTAWMLFGMWGAPLFFTFFYIFRFDDWVLSSEQEERFNQIVKARNQRFKKD